MILFFILIFLFFAIITSKIKIEVNNLKIDTRYKKYINKNYEINIIYKIFNLIPILNLKINNRKVKNALSNPTVQEKIQSEKNKIIESRLKIDKNTIEAIKKINLSIRKFKLKIIIGTEDSALTAIIIPLLSTIIAIFLENKVQELNNENYFRISPVYYNQNLIKIDFSGIFELKMIHIINTICILRKRKKGDKDGPTSNRRSYDYSYE